MKTIQGLINYEHPWMRVEPLVKNPYFIIKQLRELYNEDIQLVGSGVSGTSIISALLVQNQYLLPRLHPVIIRKSQEQTGRGISSYPIDDEWPIVIVDDDIGRGSTLRNIYSSLLELGEEKLLNCVEVVAIYKAEEHQPLLKELFPNLKLIIS